MLRVGLSVVVAAVAGVSLTGCSSAVSSNSSSEQLQALKFESDPPGAEIHTPTDQTCKTPCELSVPWQIDRRESGEAEPSHQRVMSRSGGSSRSTSETALPCSQVLCPTKVLSFSRPTRQLFHNRQRS